ncbi:MAG TPA: zf-HC2 domain-containing protein [Pyrinomonadaceae bacterium]|jgi:hypothetical protein
MNCEKVKESIEAFHDGAINDAVKIRTEEHIAGCASCAAAFDRLRALSDLLRKDVAPATSGALDRKLMRAFAEKYELTAKSPARWSGIFSGSLSIPKPAFAAGLIAVAVAITAANLIGRRASIDTTSNRVSTAPAAFSQPSPEAVEQTKIVEVPVVRERVITRVVYVERPSQADEFKTRFDAIHSRARNLPGKTIKEKKGVSSERENISDLAMNGSVGRNGYFTSGDLTGFQPAAELKARIVEEKK